MKFGSRSIAIISLIMSFITIGSILLYFFYDFSFKYVIGLIGISQIFAGINQINLSKQVDESKGKLNKGMGIFMICVGIVLIAVGIII